MKEVNKASGFYFPLIYLVILIFLLMTKEVFSASINSQKEGSGRRGNSTDGSTAKSTSERFVRKVVSEVTKDVEIPCPIAHRTSQRAEWYKQNQSGRGKKRITQFRNRYELSSLGTMKIHSLSLEDSGTYVCKVANKSEMHFVQVVVSGEDSVKNNHLKPPSNKKGSKEDSGEEVYSEPQILRSLLPKEKVHHVSKGSPSLILKCESSGNPKPTITWFKNGDIISSSTTSVSNLKLINVSHADNGLYRCESVNLFGVSKYEVTIQVTDHWFGAAEILNLSPRNLTVPEGSVVNISCTAKFELEPWFSWVRKVTNNKTESGKVFFHSGTDSYYEVLKTTMVKARGEGIFSTDLVINNITKNYSGIYYCAVAGHQGYNLKDAIILVEPDPAVQLSSINAKGVSAQWAILWTTSFIFLVMLVIICFIKLYGCRPSKPSIKAASISANSKSSQHCHLPESSPLTMSTQCTTTTQGGQGQEDGQDQESFVPLMVGSCSGLSSHTGTEGCQFENFEYDYDYNYYSPTASNSFIYPCNDHRGQRNHSAQTNSHFAGSSWESSASTNDCCESLRSYRPNSMCSEYNQCKNSNASNQSCRRAYCGASCGSNVNAVGVHKQRQYGRRGSHSSRQNKNFHPTTANKFVNVPRQCYPAYPSRDSNSNSHSRYSYYNDNENYCQSTTDCESCVSDELTGKNSHVVTHSKRNKKYLVPSHRYDKYKHSDNGMEYSCDYITISENI